MHSLNCVFYKILHKEYDVVFHPIPGHEDGGMESEDFEFLLATMERVPVHKFHDNSVSNQLYDM
jgi:hypothetical protein